MKNIYLKPILIDEAEDDKSWMKNSNLDESKIALLMRQFHRAIQSKAQKYG